ncbi:MAG: retroviral-like aspartic protease family protein [Acidobacteria bacterium]|nr:retroviral-like aspartic protease family protein [Acidobacteriota bacterium]MCI0625016.1 retroviral-like aspartic protease family protein [Acidobacteriota bacterium]MCI0719314.1 retroviral-like aspartic protease family protein [Acidobacteriota bacterium]
MGEVRVKVRLTSSMDEALARRGQLPESQVRHYEADALVDTGAVTSIVPDFVARQLGLMAADRKVVECADGRREAVEMTEPVTFEIQGRKASDGVLVLGDEVLVGQVTLEQMDLIVDCTNRRVSPNPAHPDQPVLKIK